jgi:hypothetical protein
MSDAVRWSALSDALPSERRGRYAMGAAAREQAA